MTRASKSWRPQYARGYVMEISSSLDTFPPHSRLPFALLLALSLSFSLSSPSPPFFPHSLSLGAPSSLFLTSTSSIDSHLSVPFRNGLFPSFFFFFFLFRNDFFFLSFFTNRVPTGNGDRSTACVSRVCPSSGNLITMWMETADIGFPLIQDASSGTSLPPTNPSSCKLGAKLGMEIELAKGKEDFQKRN